MNGKEALLLGIILGDGSIGLYSKSQYKITITGHSIDDKKFLLNIVKPLLDSIFNIRVAVRERKDKKATDVYFYSKKVFHVLRDKWRIEAGKKREVKIARSFISDVRLMKKIVSGFFATDGSLVITNNNGVLYPRVEFQNISLTVLKQVRKFLADFKIKGGLYKMNRDKSIVYRLQYNGKENLSKFRRNIGFINPKHEKKFQEYIKNAGVV